MTRFSRLTVYTTMIQTGMVPLFYHDQEEEAACAVQALLDAGVRCVEFTNRGEQAHLVFEKLVQRFRKDERLILGAGTMMDPPTAALYLQLGANFLVSPIFDPQIARLCNRRMAAYIPGTGTVAEISQAQEMGAEICKVFPGGQLGGPGFIKAVLGPLPWARLMPTGGVTPTQASVQEWIKAGAASVGLGSNLINKNVFKESAYDALRETAGQVLVWIREARNSIHFTL